MANRNPTKAIIDESVESTDQMTPEQLKEFARGIIEETVKNTLKIDVGRALHEELAEYEFENVEKVAAHLLSDNFTEVISLANIMIDGNADITYHECDSIMVRLAGYYTRCAIAASIYEGQYRKAYSDAYLKAKEYAQRTDGTAHQMATLQCAAVDAKKILFWTMKDSIMEMINVLKKIRESSWEESRRITSIQPG